MNAKIDMHQYVISIKPWKIDTIDINYSTVTVIFWSKQTWKLCNMHL